MTEPSAHLFRQEAGRMVATLTRIFGLHNLTLAEDVVQDAFCRALEVWKFRGIPENPSAWLMATAKRRALDVLRREQTARRFAPELAHYFESEWTLAPAVAQQFAPDAIQDGHLRMMFSCCHPRLPEEAQVALMLNILCGFSVEETAAAFVSSRSAMEKRIARAKKVLATSKNLFEIERSEDFVARLPIVQRALYLLFNEGYHGASPESAVRVELCREARRLVSALLAYPPAATPTTFALGALMAFHAARLPTRTSPFGELLSLADQDRSRWDKTLIEEGQSYLERSANGPELTEFHIEAAMAWIHTTARSAADTDWKQIVALYDLLLKLRPSPVIELNRAIAIGEWKGPAQGLEEIQHIARSKRIARYPFYHAAQGELKFKTGDLAGARTHFETATQLARSPVERRFFETRKAACEMRS